MARNQYAGTCYVCGLRVTPGTGHFEKHGQSWRVKHANVPGHGRITCDMAKMQIEHKEREKANV